MNRAEFLSILRESLEGNMPKEDVEANLRYYRDILHRANTVTKRFVKSWEIPVLLQSP